MDEQQESTPEPHDPYGAGSAPAGVGGAPEYARPQNGSRRTWVIAGAVGVVVLAVGGFFGVKALAGGGSSTSTTASQAPAGGQGAGRRGTVGILQSIDGSTLTVATFNRGGANGGGGAGAPGATGNTTTVTTGSSTKFYKTVSGTFSDIKVGDRVTANGTPAGTDTVTAERIADTGTMTGAGFGGFGGGGGGGRRFRNGNGNGTGANGSTPPSNPNVTRPDPNSFANGTVKSISGTTLTVTDAQGATKTIETTGSTTYAVLKAVAINDLQTGQPVVIGGKTNSDGTVSATTVLQGIGGGPGGGFGGRFGGRFGGGDGNGPQGTQPGSDNSTGNGSTTQ